MAIDPPYRLDPFRNIINIHWGEEEETWWGTGGPPLQITAGARFGILYLFGGNVYYVGVNQLNNAAADIFFPEPNDAIHGMSGAIFGSALSPPNPDFPTPPSPGDFTGDVSGTSVTWNVWGRVEQGRPLIWGPWVADYSDYFIATKHVGQHRYNISSIVVGSMQFNGTFPYDYSKNITLIFDLVS